MIYNTSIFGKNEILDFCDLGQNGAIWVWSSKNSSLHPVAQQYIGFSTERSCQLIETIKFHITLRMRSISWQPDYSDLFHMES